MDSTRKVTGVLALAICLSACSDAPIGPDATAQAANGRPQPGKVSDGTGLVIDNATGVDLPLIGEIGTVNIDQAVITELVLVEGIVGNIIGVNARGVLQLSGGALGSEIVSQELAASSTRRLAR